MNVCARYCLFFKSMYWEYECTQMYFNFILICLSSVWVGTLDINYLEIVCQGSERGHKRYIDIYFETSSSQNKAKMKVPFLGGILDVKNYITTGFKVLLLLLFLILFRNAYLCYRKTINRRRRSNNHPSSVSHVTLQDRMAINKSDL